MDLIVQRTTADAVSVLGDLSLNGAYECHTLEPPYKTDGSKPRAIPAAKYELTIRHSPRFNRMMPHVENVSGFAGVLVHWGNFPKDTEACTLVGLTEAKDFVGHSVAEFDLLFAKLLAASVHVTGDGEQEVRRVGTITYLDPPTVSDPEDVL